MTRADIVNTTLIAIACAWICLGVAIFPAKRQP